MKKLIVSIIILSLISAIAWAYEFEEINKGYSYSANLYSKGTYYYKYYAPSSRLVVFTLKNLNGESDFDLFIYKNSSMTNPIGKSESSGTTTERELVSVSGDYGQYFYIKVVNYGDSFSRFKLYPHEIDYFGIAKDVFLETAAEALLETIIKSLLDIEDDSEAERNVERATTVIMGVFQEKNLAEIGSDLLISEITSVIRKELGYGFLGSFAVNYATSLIKEVYRY